MSQQSISSPTLAPPTTTRCACPLVDKLPAELREEIYSHLSIGTLDYPRMLARDTWISAATAAAAVPPTPAATTPSLHIPALARTCRRLRADVLGRYLGDLHAELSDSSELDGVFFERCLRALGSAILHVRRLTIDHKVDVCLDEDMNDAIRVRANTVFEVKKIGSYEKRLPCADLANDPVSVSVVCEFEPSILIGDDKLPEPGSVCACPLSDRLPQLTPLLPAKTRTESQQDGLRPAPTPRRSARIHECALTQSVSSFLSLMDTESHSPRRETRPRFHPGGMGYSPSGSSAYHWRGLSSIPTKEETSRFWPWPVCEKCQRKRWFLQGPVTDLQQRQRELEEEEDEHDGQNERRGKARRPRLVEYAGYLWIECPYVPANMSHVAAADDYMSCTPRCRWGPNRPRLVVPYGQKSRRFLT